MSDELTPEETKQILDALNIAVDKGPWNKSIFLRAIGKKLEGIREDFKSGLSDEVALVSNAELAKSAEPESGVRRVYISLYSAQGKNLEQWERIIGSLFLQTITRPTYNSERDVKEALKVKGNIENEGYVVVQVAEKDILKMPVSKQPIDRLGIRLLSLKKDAIKPENIENFFHKENSYLFESGKLVQK